MGLLVVCPLAALPVELGILWPLLVGTFMDLGVDRILGTFVGLGTRMVGSWLLGSWLLGTWPLGTGLLGTRMVGPRPLSALLGWRTWTALRSSGDLG